MQGYLSSSFEEADRNTPSIQEMCNLQPFTAQSSPRVEGTLRRSVQHYLNHIYNFSTLVQFFFLLLKEEEEREEEEAETE